MSQDAAIRFAASSVGSIIAESITYPIDTAKVRLQLQSGATGTTQYRGMLDCLSTVTRQEGLGGLFNGINPALVRQVCYSSLTLVLYEPIRDAISDPTEDIPFYKRLLAAGTSGAIAITVFNPTEILKTQMQASSTGPKLSMLDVTKAVYRGDGIRGFWAGVQPNIARTFLVNAAELGTYDQAKHWLVHNVGMAEGPVAHISASGIAGFTSAVVSTPVDVVKTRLMNQAGGASKQYSGMMEALFHPSKSIVANEGFTALYKGFTPIFWRKIVWCSAFFVVYERLRDVLGME